MNQLNTNQLNKKDVQKILNNRIIEIQQNITNTFNDFNNYNEFLKKENLQQNSLKLHFLKKKHESYLKLLELFQAFFHKTLLEIKVLKNEWITIEFEMIDILHTFSEKSQMTENNYIIKVNERYSLNKLILKYYNQYLVFVSN
jgi:hypothetical protein